MPGCRDWTILKIASAPPFGGNVSEETIEPARFPPLPGRREAPLLQNFQSTRMYGQSALEDRLRRVSSKAETYT